MKKNIQKTFLRRISTKTFYLMTLFALVAVAVMGFLLVPTFNSTGTVSAQDRANVERATTEMLSISLDIKTAGNFAILADRGISDTGNSKIKGDVGVAGKDAAVSLDRANIQGNTYINQEGQSVDTLRAQKDLAASFNAINQLPCTDVADAELGGRKFTPGVYCLSSARLAGQVVLDAENDPKAVFLFRVAGSLNTKGDSGVSLVNSAQANNVFFVAGDSVNVGKNSDFQGSIFAENSVKVDNGATVSGRILSLKGDVTLDGATVVLVDGTLEICKVVDPASPNAAFLTGRIFQFTVTNVTRVIEAPANGCSGPFTVPGAGNVVITEQNTSRAIGSPTLVGGNFQLVDVRQINRQPGAANAVTAFNLPLRTANVTVPMGGVESQVTIQFTNQFAIVAFVEICKFGLDSDVTGFFRFTIDGVPQQTSLPAQPLQVFMVPVGGCAGPIAVTVPSDGTGVPRSGIVTVRELAQIGFRFDGATTNPPDRLLTVTIVNNTTTAGIVTARVFEAENSINTSNQTTINFFNRSNPGRVKVCKVAGPGIAEGTPFNFTVTGTGPVVDPVTGAFSTQAITRTFDVQAGPAANGGFCRFVPDESGAVTSAQTFVVGTNVTITENGPLVTANNESIRVIRITSTSGFVVPAIAGNVFFPPNGTVRTVTVPVRREVVEVEFTNAVFRPGALKVCKVAGPGVTPGTFFTFDVTFDRLQGTFPAGPGAPNTITRTVTVAAGDAAQGGFCTFVDGPFTPGINGFNSFNVGSLVTVTERSVTGVGVTSITTSSGGALTTNLPGRTGTVTIVPGQSNNGVFSPGTTEIEFVNSAVAVTPPVERPTLYDFDGDKKADISVFRDGNWYLNRTTQGFSATQFGSSTDKLVTADYDGDKKADIATFRGDANKAYFYILDSSTGAFRFIQFGVGSDIAVPADWDGDGKADIAVYRDGANAGDASYIYYRPSSDSSVNFRAIQFGAKGDKPVVGDYDGDRKADAAVFRPSNGVWYMLRSTAGFTAVQFGISTDVPVAADYDGDGKTDVAVYRGGTWYLLRSNGGFTGVQFGMGSDMPVPADFDGDGKADIAVFRSGAWYWLNSRDGGFKTMNFGIASDRPVLCPASNQ